MYKIKSNGAVAYSDTEVFIRLHTNGCYVTCAADEAEGVCVKLPTEYVDEETGEVQVVPTDTVFRLREDGLHGTEPLATIEEVTGSTIITEQEQALAILFGEDV